MFCRYKSLVVPSGTLGPVHIKVQCGLHDAVQLIDGMVSPSVTVYVVVGGNSVTDSGPSKRNKYYDEHQVSKLSHCGRCDIWQCTYCVVSPSIPCGDGNSVTDFTPYTMNLNN